MHPTLSWITATCVVLVGLVAVTACRGTPEQRIAQKRADYSAELLAFAIQREPEPEPEIPMPEAPEEDEELPDLEADEDVEPVPRTENVILDILVRWQGFDRLPGLTLDITHVDAARQEKGWYHLWVDTSRLERGPGEQITHVLEGVAYEEGDGFHVGVRRQVPPDEYHLYREFPDAL